MNGNKLPIPALSIHRRSPIKKQEKSLKRKITERACDLCRQKKIRCDYNRDSPEAPCTSCKNFEKPCTFNEIARKRGPPKGYAEGLENRLKRMEEAIVFMSQSNGVLPKAQEEAPIPAKEQPVEREVHYYYGSSSGVYILNRALVTSNIINASKPLEGSEEDLMISRHTRYGRDLGKILNPNWKIPPKELTDHLIRLYFERMNASFPVLDKDIFYAEYRKANPSPDFIPIIITICRVTCHMLEEDLLQKHNMHLSTLFDDLTRQIRTYFQIDHQPKIETIQVLVLNSMNATKFENKDWISISLAVKMAQDLGLHRANSGAVENEAEATKKLWWSVYISDRWFSAVMDKPLAIGDCDCNIDLPLIHGLSGKDDYTMFVHFIKLSSIFGEISRRIYSPKAKKNGYKTLAMEQTLRNFEKILEEWFTHVPEGYKVTCQDLQENTYDGTKKMTEGVPMTICYYAVLVLLHRPFIDIGQVSDQEMPCIAKASEACTNAAKLAIDVARTVPTNTPSASFGWNFAIHSIFEAALIHIYNSTSEEETTRRTANKYLDIALHECLVPQSACIPAVPPLLHYLEVMILLLKEQNRTHDDTIT